MERGTSGVAIAVLSPRQGLDRTERRGDARREAHATPPFALRFQQIARITASCHPLPRHAQPHLPTNAARPRPAARTPSIPRPGTERGNLHAATWRNHSGTTRSSRGLARPRGHPLSTLARVQKGGTSMPPHGGATCSGTTRSLHGLARPRRHRLFTLARVPRGGTPMPPHEGTIHCPVCVYRYHTNHTRATAARPRPVVRLPPPPMKDGTQNDLARSYCEPRTCPTPPFLSERYPTRQTRPDPTRLPYPPSVQTSSSRRNILSAGVLTFGDDFFFFLSFFLELRFFFLFFYRRPPHMSTSPAQPK